MIFAYAKNEQENFTMEQTRKLRNLVEDHLKSYTSAAAGWAWFTRPANHSSTGC